MPPSPQALTVRSEQSQFSSAATQRPRVCGKFIYAGSDKLYIRGVTYGPFRPDENGNEYEASASELLGRCFQHEIDHLDGKLFIDYLSPLKRRAALAKWEKLPPARPLTPGERPPIDPDAT